ncbi:MAG: hypothetical protein JSV53_10205 [candidate division WOR-3 bacterium]|nr:MAG: hypothetical protein JSV53_10205 [candidate division WOR-3 bacterium]
MIRDKFKRKQTGKSATEKEGQIFAGIRAEKNGRQFMKSKGARLRKVGKVWDCSVLCLARCGARIYAGPL